METITESVKYTFNQSELVRIARDQARHMSGMTQLEEEFENAKAAHKSKVTRIDADISDCTRRITSGYEMRSVKCLVLKFRPDKDHALIVRTDSGRVLRKRKLDSEEKQLKISTSAPDSFAFEADFYEDSESDVAELVAENVPLTEGEATELREALQIRPLRKGIAAPTSE